QTPDNSGYYLFYYGFMRPSFRDFYFDDENDYRVEVIDTWNMIIKDHGYHKGKFRVQLPGREYMAIRIRRNSHEYNHPGLRPR
ncbi:MAG: DUF5605 domain-containing protein, partial [Treponema sp.]|nr:DUF5605 domain-containing protein [Treponema sp.]